MADELVEILKPLFYRSELNKLLNKVIEIKSLLKSKLPKELKAGDGVLLPKIIEKETDGIYAYTLGFVEGANLALAEIEKIVKEL